MSSTQREWRLSLAVLEAMCQDCFFVYLLCEPAMDSYGFILLHLVKEPCIGLLAFALQDEAHVSHEPFRAAMGSWSRAVGLASRLRKALSEDERTIFAFRLRK